MNFVFKCSRLIVSSIVFVCVLAVAVTAHGTNLIVESARQQTGEQHQGKESPVAGSIEGSVIDAETGQPLAYANVGLFGTQFFAMTEADGRYSILDVPPGRYAIMACMMGYEADTLCLVDVGGGKRLQLSFELIPAERDMSPIIIDDSEQLCEIHGVPIILITVDIVDEPISIDEEYEKARRMIFPHADFEIFNACLSQTLDSWSVAGCPKCVEARSIWLRYNR